MSVLEKQQPRLTRRKLRRVGSGKLESTGDRYRYAGDVSRLVGKKEADHVGNIFRLSGALQRDRPRHPLNVVLRMVKDSCKTKARLDIARPDAIGANAGAAFFACDPSN